MKKARRPYATDMSDAEWAVLGPLVQAPKLGGRPVRHDRRAISATGSATGCGRAAHGGCCPMTCHPGRRCTATSGPGGETAPGSVYMTCRGGRYGSKQGGIRSPAPASWTVKASG